MGFVFSGEGEKKTGMHQIDVVLGRGNVKVLILILSVFYTSIFSAVSCCLFRMEGSSDFSDLCGTGRQGRDLLYEDFG